MVDGLRDALVREAKRVEEDCTYSSKAHYNAAGAWSYAHLCTGLPAAIASAVAGISALKSHEVLAAGLAIFVAALTSVGTFLNPERRANSHRLAAAAFHELRNRARTFYEIDAAVVADDLRATKLLKELTGRRDELNRSSPGMPRWAFERARKGIEAGEATYSVDV
jgi:hypothetical protein